VQLLKAQGNKAFAAKEWDTAIDMFTQAIHLDPKSHVLYSNRSAAYAGKKQWDDALKDADAVRPSPEFCSCHGETARVLTTFFGGGRSTVHRDQPNLGKGLCEEGCGVARRAQVGRRDNSVRAWHQSRGLARVAKGFARGQGCAWYAPIHLTCVPLLEFGWVNIFVVDSEAADPTGMGKMFQDPSLFAKLAANPKTAPLLADPSFMQKVRAGARGIFLYLTRGIELKENGATSSE
jgi:stress-induced-phosphoprotein 1